MSGDWAAGPRVSHDLIVEPGRMDGSVEMVVRAGLQDFCPGKWSVGAGLCGLLSTCVLPPGAEWTFGSRHGPDRPGLGFPMASVK